MMSTSPYVFTYTVGASSTLLNEIEQPSPSSIDSFLSKSSSTLERVGFRSSLRFLSGKLRIAPERRG